MKNFFAAILLVGAAPAMAEEPQDIGRYHELSKQIKFQAMFGTPDVLDPAIMPYILCINPEMRDVPSGEPYDPSSYDSAPDCDDEREAAKVEAIAILNREGIETPILQEALIGETLYVIDLQAKTMALFTSERRYGGEE